MKLLHGDCLELMKQIPDNSVDMVITDPPYGMSYRSNHRKERFNRIHNDASVDILEKIMPLLDSKMKENSVMFMFMSWHRIDKVLEYIKSTNIEVKNILVWVKNNHSAGDLYGNFAKKTEFIIFGMKGRKIFEDTIKRPVDVLCFNRTNNELHPTQKPVDMIEYILSLYDDGVVLDPFMGSGTTGVACANTGRDFIGMELDEKYFEIAQERIKKASD